MQAPKPSFALTIKKGDRLILLRFEEITHLQAEDKYVTIHTLNKGQYISDFTLNELTHKLGDSFIRVHRSTIINRDFVFEARKFFKGRFTITLRDGKGTNIRTSASYAADIKKLLGI